MSTTTLLIKSELAPCDTKLLYVSSIMLFPAISLPPSLSLLPSLLTYGRQFSHTPNVGSLQELGLAVVDVLDLDDKLRLGLQGFVTEAAPSLGSEGVVGLLLPVQSLRGVDVSRQLVDDEDRPRPLPGDGVLDGALALVGVRVDLLAKERRRSP